MEEVVVSDVVMSSSLYRLCSICAQYDMNVVKQDGKFCCFLLSSILFCVCETLFSILFELITEL
jgi:hypothetical protein